MKQLRRRNLLNSCKGWFHMTIKNILRFLQQTCSMHQEIFLESLLKENCDSCNFCVRNWMESFMHFAIWNFRRPYFIFLCKYCFHRESEYSNIKKYHMLWFIASRPHLSYLCRISDQLLRPLVRPLFSKVKWGLLSH